MGICDSSAKRTLMKSITDVGRGDFRAFDNIFSQGSKLWNRFGLVCNAVVYKDIVDNCLLPNLFQQFEEEPRGSDGSST